MPVKIVELLEIVDITQDQAHLQITSQGTIQLLFQKNLKIAVIVDLCQAVKICDTFQIFILFFQLCRQFFKLNLGLHQLAVHLLVGHVQQAELNIRLLQQFRNGWCPVDLDIEKFRSLSNLAIDPLQQVINRFVIQREAFLGLFTKGFVVIDRLT